MSDFQPSRQQSDLADVLEMLLDKGIVINADIAVSIGDTQMLGVQVRAAIASFDTAARYGLEFPEGTDMRRMAEAVGDPEIAEMNRPRPPVRPQRGVNVTTAGEGNSDDEPAHNTDDEDGGNREQSDGRGHDGSADQVTDRLGARPDPDRPTMGGFDMINDGSNRPNESIDETTENDESEGNEPMEDAMEEP
ncbi:gas vesicle protein [Halobacteria archaeon AArc-curdl1]|uniref:Gas vesicle protein n=1 Tax=Natronosalvus hydrolyticus TaxID=2979988 RepID=A0AAP2ZB39_9EURY|nr:gas vesicle protein [Halobacteria archaeon AArc-curdl1]